MFYHHPGNLDEIVFEHRNKEYGAYELRKVYTGHLLTGFIIAMAAFLFICFYLFHHYQHRNARRKSGGL